MTTPVQWDGTAEDATRIIDMILRTGGTARYHDATDGSVEGKYIAVDSPSGASWRLFPGQWLWPDPRLAAYDAVYDLLGQYSRETVNRSAGLVWRAVHTALNAAGIGVPVDPDTGQPGITQRAT